MLIDLNDTASYAQWMNWVMSYLLRCEFFKVEREQYIQSNYTSPANTLNMKHLMNSSNERELINLSKFIITIVNYFKDKPNNNPV